MAFTVKFSSRAIKQLSKIDKPQQLLIVKWLLENIEGTDDPRKHGKDLAGTNYWRYRVGKYRVVVEIKDNECLVFVVKVGTRGDDYKRL